MFEFTSFKGKRAFAKIVWLIVICALVFWFMSALKTQAVEQQAEQKPTYEIVCVHA